MSVCRRKNDTSRHDHSVVIETARLQDDARYLFEHDSIKKYLLLFEAILKTRCFEVIINESYSALPHSTNMALIQRCFYFQHFLWPWSWTAYIYSVLFEPTVCLFHRERSTFNNHSFGVSFRRRCRSCWHGCSWNTAFRLMTRETRFYPYCSMSLH